MGPWRGGAPVRAPGSPARAGDGPSTGRVVFVVRGGVPRPRGDETSAKLSIRRRADWRFPRPRLRMDLSDRRIIVLVRRVPPRPLITGNWTREALPFNPAAVTVPPAARGMDLIPLTPAGPLGDTLSRLCARSGPSGKDQARVSLNLASALGMEPRREDVLRWDTRVPPPARGWTRQHAYRIWRGRGSPARAGMDPAPTTRRPGKGWFPRPRGDGPAAVEAAAKTTGVPPPARGWTLR